jgi:hypothetical protein
MNRYNVEYTDTFGGEANYSWCRRAVIEVRPEESDHIFTSAMTVARKRAAYDRDVMRKAKAAVGLTGVRGRTFHHGDLTEFRPYRSCTVLFVTYTDEVQS